MIIPVLAAFALLLLSGHQCCANGEYHHHNHNSECQTHPHPDVESMLHLIDRYIRMHGWSVLLSESPDQLCRRRFLNSVWGSTCDPIGNGIQPPLNAIVDAIILNYTVVLTPMQCEGDLEWADWMVMLKPLEGLLMSAGCPTDLRTRFDIDEEPHLNPPSRCELMHDLRSPRVITLSAGHVIDPKTMVQDVEIYGTNNGGWSGEDYFNNAYNLFRPDDERNAMHGDYLLRARIIFGKGRKGDSRFRFHGAVAKRALVFSATITHPVHALLGPRHCVHDLVIGVHSRHFDVETEEASSKFDQAFVSTVSELISKLGHTNFSCRILLASDRPHMLRLFNTLDLGCEVMANHFQTDTSSTSGTITTSEHGLFTQSQMVLKDIYLLGQADYFIGTHGSTFSSFIYNFIAFHALQNNLTLITSTFISRNGDVHLLKGYRGLRKQPINEGRLQGNTKQALDCRDMWNNSYSKTTL